MSKLRIAFMGTPDFAVSAFEALCATDHEIVAVYTQPPKPAGRGQNIQKSVVHLAAEERKIEVRTPTTLRDADEQKYFADLKLDVAVVAAYGLILPKAVLKAPRLGCINIHASLLPRWRGAAPIQRSILAGDAESGVTIMQMAEGLDTGDILLMDRTPITATTTTPRLHNELAVMGARLIVDALEWLTAGEADPKPQPTEGVTYAAKLTREDARIDWEKPATEIERQIRALQPWPSCFFMLGDEMIKVMEAGIVDKTDVPGTLMDDIFTVACGQGALRLLRIQRSGKSPTDGASFLRGTRLEVGQVL